MSYQTNSALVNAQAKAAAAFAKNELRYNNPVTFLEFLKSSPIMFPDYKELRTREDRPVEVHYAARAARTLASGRTHNHTGAVGSSGVLTPAWATYADKFVNTLKQGDNNVFSLDEMVANDINNVIANFAEGTEQLATDFLFNNRSGVNAATVEGTFNPLQEVFEITESTNGTRAAQITKQVMHLNKYSGNYTIFCDTVSYNKFEYQAFQGSANSANLSFQFMGVNFVHSTEMATLAASLAVPYVTGFWVAVPEGMIGALPWVPKQNRAGVTTSVNEYGTILNPVDGLQYAIHRYEERANGTSLGGHTQDVKKETEMSLDLAFEYAPTTVANSTPIMAFALV